MSSRIKVVLGVVLAVIVVLVLVSVLTGGDDDDSPSATRTGGDGGSKGGSKGGSGPSLRSVAQKRSQGKYATAQASGIIDQPKEIWLRLSAAPKQQVTGQWNVSCGAGATDSDTFTVTPPNLQKLRIPGKKADSCIAGANAQLEKTGRLKVTILRDR
ncbi:MAG: hypothetical protein QOE31_1772 [Solirubrobacteraceae bacterium]|jgi:hypothetical protein|nr:hypothetical protein [Solirubrobacteraceae bacterium]